MKITLFLVSASLSPICVYAENTPPHSTMVENTDGDIKPNEYRVIGQDGSVTRRPCPYTCEMKGIPAEFCKTWKSLDKNDCYVQDTRKPSDSMPNNTNAERSASMQGYKKP